MKNSRLAIAIPTYNRADILKENLLYMMKDIKKYNIPIYISDDSTNDDTKNMISELKNDYEYIFYFKNTPSLGHDKNCFYTLKLPEEDYIWYLGDSIIIENESLSKILYIIEKNNYDFIITNHIGRNLNFSNKIYDNAKNAFSELAWHLTLTGATIYKKSIISNYEQRGIYKNFPQTAIILNTIANNCNLYYISEAMTFSNKNKVSYWSENIFETFAKDWYNFVISLPNLYTIKEKKDVIKSHSLHSNIFGISSMIKYKQLNILNLKKYILYYRYINCSSHINALLILAIVLVPNWLINVLVPNWLINLLRKKS